MEKNKIQFEHVERILGMSSKLSLFGGLTDEQRRVIMDHSEFLQVKKDEYLFKRGDSPKEIYIIMSGSVAFYLEDKTIAEFGEGSSFAESALIGIQTQVVDAVATKDSELLIITKKKLMELFQKDKEVFGVLILNIARELARRLAIAGNIIIEDQKNIQNQSTTK